MRKLKSIMSLCLALLLLTVPAMAAESDAQRYVPYSTVDLNMLEQAGWTCEYDEMTWKATLVAPYQIEYTSETDTYIISFILEMSYSRDYDNVPTSCSWKPYFRLIRWGEKTASQDVLDVLHIKAGENRYFINTDSAVRYDVSGIIMDSAVEPLGSYGMPYMEYITTAGYPVTLRFGDLDAFALSDEQVAMFRTFLDQCRGSGVFEQAIFQRTVSDNFGGRIFLNPVTEENGN